MKEKRKHITEPDGLINKRSVPPPSQVSSKVNVKYKIVHQLDMAAVDLAIKALGLDVQI